MGLLTIRLLRQPVTAPASLAQNLQRVTEAALAYLDLERLLDAPLDRIIEILDVDTTAILLLDVGPLTQRPFTQEDSALLQIVADRVALAIDHARLFEE